jgi:hypothetical protein
MNVALMKYGRRKQRQCWTPNMVGGRRADEKRMKRGVERMKKEERGKDEERGERK